MSKIFEAQDGDYIQLPWAKFVFHNNEAHIDGRGVNDPTGFSFLGGNGTKLSYKNEQGEEMVLFQMRKNQNGDGEYYFGVLDQSKYAELQANGDSNALDHAMIEVATLNPDGLEIRVPIKAAAGFVGAGPTVAASDTLWAPDGLSFVQMQNDKNYVVYSTTVPFSKDSSHVMALWASGTNQ